MPVIELILAFHVFLEDFFWRVAFKQGTPRQDDVEDDTDAENVGLAVVALFLEQLGGYIAW